MSVLFPDLYLAKVCGNAFFVSKLVGKVLSGLSLLALLIYDSFLLLRNSGSELVYKLDKNMYA